MNFVKVGKNWGGGLRFNLGFDVINSHKKVGDC